VGLLGRLVLLPLAPLQGVVWLGETLQGIAEDAMNDPAQLRQSLRDAEDAHRRGDITDEELAMIEQDVLDRLVPMTVYGEVTTHE
jgi:hypothetical protein